MKITAVILLVIVLGGGILAYSNRNAGSGSQLEINTMSGGDPESESGEFATHTHDTVVQGGGVDSRTPESTTEGDVLLSGNEAVALRTTVGRVEIEKSVDLPVVAIDQVGAGLSGVGLRNGPSVQADAPEGGALQSTVVYELLPGAQPLVADDGPLDGRPIYASDQSTGPAAVVMSVINTSTGAALGPATIMPGTVDDVSSQPNFELPNDSVVDPDAQTVSQ
jgi:hypothetical protein